VTESYDNSPQPPNPPTPPNPLTSAGPSGPTGPPEIHVNLSKVRLEHGDALIADATVAQAVQTAKDHYPAGTDSPQTLFTVRVHSW
jgi:hypothetical protein